MSWKFPKHPFRDGGAINQEDANDNFREFAEELTGQLGEHNWSANTITNRNYFNSDSAFVWSRSKKDTNAVLRLSGGSSSETTGIAAGAQVIAAQASWTPIDDTRINVTCPSCLLWIHGTAQTHAVFTLADSSAVNASLYLPIVRMAIRINGSVLPETITGGVLTNQERVGVCAFYYPLGTSVLLPVPAGTHEISLVISSNPQSNSTPRWLIEGREIVCLQMRK